MITLPKELKPEIVAMRKEIARRRKEEDRWFKAICKKANIKSEYSVESDALFDYLNNDFNIIRFK
jgi:RNAse (barnase) inhibitor barstar